MRTYWRRVFYEFYFSAVIYYIYNCFVSTVLYYISKETVGLPASVQHCILCLFGYFQFDFYGSYRSKRFVGGIWLMRFSDQYHKIRKDKSIDRARRKEIKAAFDKKRRMILWTIIVINFWNVGSIEISASFFWRFSNTVGHFFYMFISIGYLVDNLFWKILKRKESFSFLLFVSFFPQLIQGPINRYDQMKEQLYGRHTLDWYRCKRALILILFGLLKKYTIANLLVHWNCKYFGCTYGKNAGFCNRVCNLIVFCTAICGFFRWHRYRYGCCWIVWN